MKFSSARGTTRSRIPLIAFLALAASIVLAACEGNDTGPSGPDTGGGGGTGPTGPTGPSDVPISVGGDVKNVGTGSALTAQQIADIGTLVATIDSATVTGNKPVIEITVKTDHGGAVLGLAATTLRLGVAKLVPAANGFPSRWQSYINRAATPGIATPVLPSAVQATTETGVAAGWTELGGGKYRYASTTDLSTVTSPIAVTYEPALTHRIGIAINLSGNAVALAPDNPVMDFVPAGGDVTTDKRIAATPNCNACHVRFAMHEGARRTTEYCVICHNPATIDPDSGESVSLAYMAHSIHRGEARPTPYVIYGFGGAKFDASEITYPQPTSFCETCHTQSDAAPQGDDWKLHPTAPACGGCHSAGLTKTGPSATTGQYAYEYTHSTDRLPPGYTVDDGECIGCHRADGVAGDILAVHQQDPDRKAIEVGKQFTYKILKVENAAVGQAPKVTFQILGPDGQPIDPRTFTSASGRLRLDFAWTPQDIHNIADIAGNAYAATRCQATVVDLIAAAASIVDAGNGTYSYTLATPLPAAFSDATLGTGLMVVLEGRRVLADGSEAHPDSAFAFSGTPREKLVEQAKCETCHKQLALHGGSRAGDPMICTICHSSSLGGTFGTETFGPLALGAFIHGLHSSNIGPIGAVTYPQSLARCTACHVEGKFNYARSTALPITVDAGTTLTTDAAALAWQDDLVDSATAGTCTGCHNTPEAQSHMQGQGGSFGVAKTLTPSSSVEGCPLCHGAGQTFDTVVEHCSKLPYGQCK